MTGKKMSDKDVEETAEFLEDIRVGTGPLNAGLAVGWSPAKVHRLMKDEEFVEMMDAAKERRLESIEKTLYVMAEKGHFKAIQMVLHNQRPNEWRDIKHIQIDKRETLDVGVVVSVKQAALDVLRDKGVAALQPAPEEIIEAEVIDEPVG